ncbi:MAG: flagellar filament capping protein FliD [Leptospirales bacterium]|nr:flagellar filament capping protein FliD [Leptospirales bacterium]
MPITVGGVASGMDTGGIIDKLVEIELKPIEAMQLDIHLNRRKIAALEELSVALKELDRASRELYGFRASYNDKSVFSSDPRVLSASATKLAEKGTHRIEVLETASAHIISTDEISENTPIMAGRFTLRVDDESFTVNFRGGKLKDLQERIDEAAADKIATSIMKTSGDKAVLTLTSKVQGQKGEILLSGNMDILKSIGLAGGMKTRETLGADLNFERRYFGRYDGDKDVSSRYGSIQTGDDGKKVTLTGALWQEYLLPVKITVKNDTVFEFAALHKQQQEEKKDEDASLSVEIGPVEKTIVDGIELKGYNISRTPPGRQSTGGEKSFDSLLGVGIVSDTGGRRTERIYPLETGGEAETGGESVRQAIPIGRDFAGKQITKVIFYCNEGEAEFSDARISASDETGNSFEPRNIVAKASDARMIVNGTEISRDKNTELTDVIKGLNFNINSVSQLPITIKVDPDIENSLEKIRVFVESYNKYIDLHLALTKIDTGKPGSFRPADRRKENDFRKRENTNGLFAGDATIIRLDNTLKTVISSSYPNRADKQIRVLSQIGVSTGSSNSAWSSIKEGRLVIDEDTLREVVFENPEGVRMFFGSDSTGDNKEDSGLAFNMVKQLTAYIGSGRNIISARIGLENDSIKSTNERIAKKEDQVRQYQDKLKAKFSTMERAISGANAQKSWMNQQMNTSGGNK